MRRFRRSSDGNDAPRADADGYERVCRLADVPPGALRGVEMTDGTRVCLANHCGTIFAISDRCPHQKFPLSDGELAVDGSVVCPRHGASFDCATGDPVRGPVGDGGAREPPFGRVHVYEVRVAADAVYVRTLQELS